MATSRTINFTLTGQDNLSKVLAQAAARVKALSNLNGFINAKALKQANRLTAAQNQLKALENYRKLQLANAQAQARLNALEQQPAKIFNQRKQAQQQLEQMRQAYQRLNDAYKNNRTAMDSAQTAAIKDALKSARNELKAQEQAVRPLDNAYDKLPSQVTKLREQLAAQQTQLANARQGLPTGTLAAHEMQLRSQIQQTTNALNAEIAALERRNQIAQNFSQANTNLSHAYSNFQSAIDTASTVMSPFKDAADNAIDYEKGLSRLKSLVSIRDIRAGNLAKVEADISSLDSTISHLGATTEYTANQVLGAANFYAMSGWNKDQINAILPATTDLASIARIDIDRVADMLSDDMTAFGIKAGESYKLASGKIVDGAKYMSDATAYAVTQANMDYSIFHEAWKYNAPVAHAMDLSLGQAVAQNMILANAGIKGSMSGTSLRQFWVRLAAPPKAAQKSLEEMGMTASDATKQIRETQEALAEAGVSMDDDLFTRIEAAERFFQEGKKAGKDMTGWLKNLTGQTALSGIETLFDVGKLDEAKRIIKEIDSGEIAGWSQDTAKVMRDNTFTAIEYVKSALDALQKNAGDALLPTIRAAAESINPLVTSLAQWTKEHPRVVQGLAAIAAAASVATISIAGFSLAMAGVRFAQAGFQTAGLVFSDLSAKIVAASTALRGLTLANIGATLSSGLTAAANAARLFGTAILTATRSALMFVFTPVGAALMAIGLAAYYAYSKGMAN